MGGRDDSVEIELIHTLQRREKVSDRVLGSSDMITNVYNSAQADSNGKEAIAT